MLSNFQPYVLVKTRRNTSLCSVFENLEAKAIMFSPELTNPFAFVQSTESSSNPKYDVNGTQNISTMRAKTLYGLREKMSKYTPRSV